MMQPDSDRAVNCLYDDDQDLFISSAIPTRSVKPVLFGFACYEKPSPDAATGDHKGITDQMGAYQWLRGEEPHQLLKVAR